MIDFEGFINCFYSSDPNLKVLVEVFAVQIMRYPQSNDFDPYYVSRFISTHMQNMIMEDLTQFHSTCLVIRIMIDHLFRPRIDCSCEELSKKLDQFIAWMKLYKNEFIRLGEQEKARIPIDHSSYIKETCMRAIPFYNYPKRRVIDGIRDLKTNMEEITIVLQAMKIAKTIESMGGTLMYVPENHAPSQIKKPMTKDFEECIKKYNERMKKTEEEFQDVLKRESEPKRVTFCDVSSQSPNPSGVQVVSFRQEQCSELVELPTLVTINDNDLLAEKARKEQSKKFEDEFTMKKQENGELERKMRSERIDRDLKIASELQKEYEKQREKHEEEYRRIKTKTVEYEKETLRLVEGRLFNFIKCTEEFFACAYKKQLFEQKEKEWAWWLDSLKESIFDVKTQFKLFEKKTRDMLKNESSYQKVLMKELFALHESTISAYDLLFEACNTVKKLDNQFPDAVFLQILHEKLANVANKLCEFLESIDNCLNDESPKAINNIRTLIEELKTSDIPTTEELRRESRKPWNAVRASAGPRVYGQTPSEIIVEVLDEELEASGSY